MICYRACAEPVGSVVDSLVHRIVWWSGGIFPHRKLFRMVLSSRGPTRLGSYIHSAKRGHVRPKSKCHRNTTSAVPLVRTAFVRLGELRGQAEPGKARYLRDPDADPGTGARGSASIGQPQ